MLSQHGEFPEWVYQALRVVMSQVDVNPGTQGLRQEWVALFSAHFQTTVAFMEYAELHMWSIWSVDIF